MSDAPRRPVAWLPVDRDWEGPVAVRHKLIDLLQEAAGVGPYGILIRSTLAMAEATAVRIEADLTTEVGRAAVAVALEKLVIVPTRTVLGLKIGAERFGTNPAKGGVIGWALVNDTKFVDGKNVVEVFLSDDSPS